MIFIKIMSEIFILLLKGFSNPIKELLIFIFKKLPYNLIFGVGTSTVTIMIFLFFFKEDLFFFKFKSEINYIPQAIDQNLKEIDVISNMLLFSKECPKGFFTYTRIEASGEKIYSHFKHIIGFKDGKNEPFDLLGSHVSKEKIFHKRYSASEDLKDTLLSSIEGKIYTLHKGDIEDHSGSLEPINMLFKYISTKYTNFKYVPIFHKHLGLIILIGYLEIDDNLNCSSLEVEAYLDKLYRIYRYE